MRRQAIAAVLFSMAFAAVSSGQVIYEPVQSQYRTPGGGTFYYGGSSPRAFEYARQRVDCQRDGTYARDGRYGVGFLSRGPIGQPYQYTFTDCAPYRNAIVYGYTSTDARNDAYANVPRYFRMNELVASAVPAEDGVGYVVPAQARGTIDIRPSRPTTRPASGPASGPAVGPAGGAATEPKPVMVIPKKAMEKPADAKKILTDAR